MRKTIFLAAYVAACGVVFANTDTVTFVRELDEVVINAPVAQVTNNHTKLTRDELNQATFFYKYVEKLLGKRHLFGNKTRAKTNQYI